MGHAQGLRSISGRSPAPSKPRPAQAPPRPARSERTPRSSGRCPLAGPGPLRQRNRFGTAACQAAAASPHGYRDRYRTAGCARPAQGAAAASAPPGFVTGLPGAGAAPGLRWSPPGSMSTKAAAARGPPCPTRRVSW
ncbi:translation initiation factor IF-2-like [Passer montanus]|uniref:translation initiation factor IF-2-like n=1 Tax=Passer montanus TaxID=9160 RepID=UPI0019601600|nr:translation initiation factor IF-2-like [Passer montanus]